MTEPTRIQPVSKTFRDGVVASLALVPSVFVYGSVFGGLAVQAGLTPPPGLGMSVLVFAGASQFVAGAPNAPRAAPPPVLRPPPLGQNPALFIAGPPPPAVPRLSPPLPPP